MIRYHYRDEWGSLGKIARPVANVILENDGLQVGTSMYVDSGADLTMIPFQVIFNERKGWVDFKKHRTRKNRRL